MKNVLGKSYSRQRACLRRVGSGVAASIFAIGAVLAVGGNVSASPDVGFAVIDCNLAGDQFMLADGKANPADWTVTAIDGTGQTVRKLEPAQSDVEREIKIYRSYTVPAGTVYDKVRFESATAKQEVDPVAEDCTNTPVKLTTGDPGTGLVAIPPARLADTRGPVTDDFTPGMVPAGKEIGVKVTGVGSVPADATAVLLNVAAVQPTGFGHLRVYPCGTPLPKTSTLNYVEGEPRAASTLVKPGTNGRVCVYTSTETHMIVDVQGYVAAESALNAITPVRVADSRPGAPVDGPGLLPKQQVNGAVTLDMTKVADKLGIPAGAEGYVFNVTTANAATNGYVTVNRCQTTFRPATVSSAANFVPGRATANLAYGSFGDKICVFTNKPVDLMIDVVGYTTSRYGAPQLLGENLRLLETRAESAGGNGTMDKKFNAIGRLAAGTELKLAVAGRKAWWGAEVPTNLSAAVLNITAVRPSANGHVVAYECGKKPATSNLNMRPGGATPNASLVPVGADGTICVYTSVETDLVIDITGFVASAKTPMMTEPIELSEAAPATTLRVLGGTAPYTLSGDLPAPVEISMDTTGKITYTGDADSLVHYTGTLTVTDANGLTADVDVIVAWYPAAADVEVTI